MCRTLLLYHLLHFSFGEGNISMYINFKWQLIRMRDRHESVSMIYLARTEGKKCHAKTMMSRKADEAIKWAPSTFILGRTQRKKDDGRDEKRHMQGVHFRKRVKSCTKVHFRKRVQSCTKKESQVLYKSLVVPTPPLTPSIVLFPLCSA